MSYHPRQPFASVLLRKSAWQPNFLLYVSHVSVIGLPKLTLGYQTFGNSGSTGQLLFNTNAKSFVQINIHVRLSNIWSIPYVLLIFRPLTLHLDKPFVAMIHTQTSHYFHAVTLLHIGWLTGLTLLDRRLVNNERFLKLGIFTHCVMHIISRTKYNRRYSTHIRFIWSICKWIVSFSKILTSYLLCWCTFLAFFIRLKKLNI